MRRGWRKSPSTRSLGRSFSSIGPNRPASIMDGYDGLKDFWKRCIERAPAYEKYKQANVLYPSSFPFTRHWGPFQFALLQSPTQTEIDLLEFMEGAQMAVELVTRTYYEEDLRKYALSLPKLTRLAILENTGEFYEAMQALQTEGEPDCVKLMRRGVSKVCFEAIVMSIQNSNNAMHAVDLIQLDIDKMHLDNVKFHIVPRSIIQGSRAFRTYASVENLEEGTQNLEKEDITEELLELRVISQSKEHIKVYADGNKKTLTRPNRASWAFASCVTTPEQLDWRMADIHLHTID
uniref:Uncharacterized protein AlNc14C16G1787 n=1 Tax=Albugo laibachii Nc14 TaxID=890382 RepID=F0W4B6_9STRA|nr:conserved hypothetical protein [Albugo laibachii Nc14]|eukprot:CCA15949.1 conserved hypothetical protein [Albugo laibachii Nc14]